MPTTKLNRDVPSGSSRACPVAEKMRHHTANFGPAASDAIDLQELLDDALYGLAKGLTSDDIKAADIDSLRVVRDNLADLMEQAQAALATVQQILDLRTDPRAQWPE